MGIRIKCLYPWIEQGKDSWWECSTTS